MQSKHTVSLCNQRLADLATRFLGYASEDGFDSGVPKKPTATLCKISGKIEFSHHIFVMAFFVRRKQRKAPREAGRGSFTITAIFSRFYKTNTFTNGYSER